MSHTIVLNRELGVIVLRARERMEFAEFANIFAEILALPGFEPGLPLVADFRQGQTQVSTAEIRQLAAHAHAMDGRWGVAKWSILPSNDLTYALARMFGTLTSDCQVTTQVFRDLKSASDWLGLGVGVSEILDRTAH